MNAPGLARARALVGDASRVVVLTGAGVSAESGVPTFRGPQGLWKRHRSEELATPGAFARDPRLVWEWYAWRRDTVGACAPNQGHRALAAFQASRAGVTLVTQNVDGLHEIAAREAAGRESEPAAPVELHGSLFRVRCTSCGTRRAHREPVDASDVSTLPRCGACGALLRPDVVWFGEPLDPGILAAAFEAARGADVCLVVGTSAVVHPAASLPLATLESGGAVVEVNPEATPVTRSASVSLRGPAGDLLPPLLG
ncbi:MAG: NAD-dependent deacylase [Gemmatimonadetes bacterium]|nr:NAD-dependent deacylase [Gemmatimonadota bacterium]